MRTQRLWHTAGGIAAGWCARDRRGMQLVGHQPAARRGTPSSRRPPDPRVRLSLRRPPRLRPTAGAASADAAAVGGGRAGSGRGADRRPAGRAARPRAGEIAKLSPEQLAGQRVIYSYNGLTAPAGLLTLIRHGDVGGVIFFSFNISSEAQLKRRHQPDDRGQRRVIEPGTPFPLLLMTDQEGGQVRRLPWARPSQSEAQIGASADPSAAAATAGSRPRRACAASA